ncbi:MAG TPA: histidine kinase [Gemmatimonadaceae bacterium]|nr:histidine kinase [Gemmatimonadaceae bacterium]
MATSAVDAPATDPYTVPPGPTGSGAAPGAFRDGNPDQGASGDPRRATRSILLWIWVAVVSTAFSAAHVVDLPAARVSGMQWWVVWLVAAHRGLWLTLWLYVIVQLSERFPLGRAELGRRLGIHTLAAITLAAVSAAEMFWFVDVTPIPEPRLLRPDWPYFFNLLVTYAIFAVLAHAVVYARRYWQVRGTAQRLRAELEEAGRRRSTAELRALKAELSPQFLGNALEAVSTFVRTDPTAAQRVLAELGDLLRLTLTRSRTQEVSLREELETLDAVLDVERARLGWRFEVDVDVPAETQDALMPDMILRPMVENAIRRGLGSYHAGRIRIDARRSSQDGDILELRVTAEGTGLQADPHVPMAPVAMASWVANTRARLAELYGPRATLTIAAPADPAASSASCLTVPWHEVDAELAGSDVAARTTTDLAGLTDAGYGRKARRLPVVPAISMVVLSTLFTFVHLKRVYPDGTSLPVPLRFALPAGIIAAGILVAVGCTAFHLARRYPPSVGAHWGRALIAHARAALLLGIIGTALRMGNSWIVGYLFERSYRVVKLVAIPLGLIAHYMTYYAILAVVAYGFEYARRYRRARVVARNLSAELAEVSRRRAAAELSALKAELNPHFLGNALHTVSTLVRTNPAGAERVLGQLGELLRASAMRARTHEVTLREELETLEPYLAVEQTRLGQRLGVSWDVDEGLLEARVPHMILQPLVENAVKHGLAPRNTEGHIDVRARRRADRLEVSIHDDGVGLACDEPRPVAGQGVGLSNARARLAELYGHTATLEVVPGDAGGTVARLSLPWVGSSSASPVVE